VLSGKARRARSHRAHGGAIPLAAWTNGTTALERFDLASRIRREQRLLNALGDNVHRKPRTTASVVFMVFRPIVALPQREGAAADWAGHVNSLLQLETSGMPIACAAALAILTLSFSRMPSPSGAAG